MKFRLKRTQVAIFLCCCSLAVCAKEPSIAAQPTATKSMTKISTSPATPTQTTTDKVSGTIDIPKFDFSVFDNSKTEKKSAIADIPTIDFSKKTKPAATKGFCQTDICKLMDGICNNSRCIPQDCESFVCKCNPGYTGPYCRNATDVIKAKEVQTVNGKIVTTETPPDSTTNGNPQHNVVNGPNAVSLYYSTSTSKHDLTNPVEKYKQPTGSFLKGPEVPSPSSEKPIKINVKSQRIRGKSTTIIEQPSASVTIATVSVNLEQSLSGEVSGQTTKRQSKLDRKASNRSMKSSKNVDRVFLTSGKVDIVNQSVTPLDMTSVSKRKEFSVHV